MMIYNSALCIDSTGSSAWIHTLVVDTSQLPGAVIVGNTLRFALNGWFTKVSR
jgi:hypothetical protein